MSKSGFYNEVGFGWSDGETELTIPAKVYNDIYNAGKRDGLDLALELIGEDEDENFESGRPYYEAMGRNVLRGRLRQKLKKARER